MNKFVLVAIAMLQAAAISAVAADPLVLQKTIPLKGVDGKLDHLAVDTKGQRLFVANKPNNTLDIVDLKTGELVKQIADQGKVSGVDFAADLNMIYVGNGAGFCNAFEGKEYKLVFSTPAKGADNVHYYPTNKTVYVAHDDTLSVLDAKTGEIKKAIKLPGDAHGFKIDGKAGKIYVVLTKPSVIAVVDIATHTVGEKYPLTKSDAGSPIDQDVANHLLLVGCPKKPMVVVFDTKTGKEVSSVAIPGGIDDIHFDAARDRIYASCGDNVLAVLGKKGNSYEIILKIETPKFSRTCVYADGMLYLGVPKGDGREGPEIRIFAAK